MYVVVLYSTVPTDREFVSEASNPNPNTYYSYVPTAPTNKPPLRKLI